MKLLGEGEQGGLEYLGATPCISSVSPAIRSPLSPKGWPKRPSVTGIQADGATYPRGSIGRVTVAKSSLNSKYMVP